MSSDPTIPQGGPERQRSQQLSLRPGTPPSQIPGYEFERFLGDGAYGEVWVALEKNTGRHVAVKFYRHGGGLDWSLLAREVEKLAFLFADRYVVQLIGVGWDASPPYYVMEYLEKGSVAERIQSGPLSVAEAIEVFHDVAVGLVHAHGKGVLHCDLKPANILLDQDSKPRLADFGQSRLSHEQAPTLGTLFYMAPEQADLKAVPDARWDVYALGALLYCMLTGGPPHRTPEAVEQLEAIPGLEQRLAAYRRLIRRSPPPTAHREVPGVDRALGEIVDRCLAPDPAKRYPNVQVVLDALAARAARRAFRPMMVLGALGPLVLLVVVAWFAWMGFSTSIHRSEEALVGRALENNRLTAMYVAGLASKELHRRCEAVEQVAASESLRQCIVRTIQKPPMRRLSQELSDSTKSESELEPLRDRFRQAPDRRAFQKEFDAALPSWMRPPEREGAERDDEVASWFFCDADGLSTVRVPESKTIGKNFAWRSFFHGGKADRPEDWRPPPGQRLKATTLSAVFQSRASNAWIVAVATPVFASPGGEFLGVVALTVRVNRFVELEGNKQQFAVLVDLREGDHTGMVLQHPVFDHWLRKNEKIPSRFQAYRLASDDLPTTPERMEDYRDPLAADPEAEQYRKHWLARIEPVGVRGKDVGWAVIVQESYDTAIGTTLAGLRSDLIGHGLAAVGMVVLVLAAVWGLTFRLLHESTPLRRSGTPGQPTERSATAASPTGTNVPMAGRPPNRGVGKQE